MQQSTQMLNYNLVYLKMMLLTNITPVNLIKNESLLSEMKICSISTINKTGKCLRLVGKVKSLVCDCVIKLC